MVLLQYVAVAIVFIVLETFAPMIAGQRRAREGWRADIVLLLANTVLFAIGLGVAAGVIGTLVHRGVPSSITTWIVGLPLWAQSLLAIALGDLGVYAAHRLEHATPLLWRFHSIHHSAEELDFLVAVRNHPVDQFVQKAGQLIPLIALGISPQAMTVYALVYFWQAFLAHANVNINYGPLRWILVSPDFHHWHHAEEREAYDHNFAGMCAFWDVVFRTAYMPAARRPDRYGLTERLPRSPLGLLWHPFSRSKSPTSSTAETADAARKDTTTIANEPFTGS